MAKKKKKKTVDKSQRTEDTLKYRNLNDIVSRQFEKSGIDINQFRSIETPDGIRMSAIILKLADPYIKKYWGKENRVQTIISISIAAWNMTFLPPEEQEEMQKKCIDVLLPPDCHAKDVAELIKVFDELMQRKRELFPEIQKIIIGHDLHLDKNNIKLDISSVPINK